MSMEHFIVNVLIAMGIASTPAIAADTKFELMGTTDQFSVEVDLNSVEIDKKNLDYEINATMKRVLRAPLLVKGKKKPGTYYIERTRVRCSQDDLTFIYSALFADDGEILVSGELNKVYPNMKIKGNFITDYIEIACNTAKNTKPAVLT